MLIILFNYYLIILFHYYLIILTNKNSYDIAVIHPYQWINECNMNSLFSNSYEVHGKRLKTMDLSVSSTNIWLSVDKSPINFAVG